MLSALEQEVSQRRVGPISPELRGLLSLMLGVGRSTPVTVEEVMVVFHRNYPKFDWGSLLKVPLGVWDRGCLRVGPRGGGRSNAGTKGGRGRGLRVT